MPDDCLHECRNPRCGNYRVAGGRGYCHECAAAPREYDGPVGSNLTPANRRFRRLRVAFLRIHPMCAKCKVEPATDLDHIVAHRGNPQLYWSQANWQGLCHRCHAAKTWRETLSHRSMGGSTATRYAGVGGRHG